MWSLGLFAPRIKSGGQLMDGWGLINGQLCMTGPTLAGIGTVL